MSLDTYVKFNIASRRTGSVYTVHAFKEYSIDADMETDTDQFNIVIENPNGEYTGIFNKYDAVSLYVYDEEVMHGYIDEVLYSWDDNDSTMQIVGRDSMSVLVDNDAIPRTLNNVNPVDYVKKKCIEYDISVDPSGVPRVKSSGDFPIIEKVVIGTNETEMAVINNMMADGQNRIWFDGPYMCMGNWDTGAVPSYYFTRGVIGDKSGIPIKSLRLRDSALGVKSEALIYGTMDDGAEKVLGTAKNDELVGMGITRRMVMASYGNDKSTKYSGSALRQVRDSFRSGIELVITIKTGSGIDKPIWINKTANVIDTVTKINSIFYIKGVNYTKSPDAGSITTITMTIADQTLDVLWTHIGRSSSAKNSTKYGSIVGLPEQTGVEIINDRK